MFTLRVCQEATKGNASSIEQLGAVLCLAETSVLRLQETPQCLWLCWIACMHKTCMDDISRGHLSHMRVLWCFKHSLLQHFPGHMTPT